MDELLREIEETGGLRIEEVAALARVHFTSCFRWILRGLPSPTGERVKLEATRAGRKWLTSRPAVQRFFERITPGRETISIPAPRSPTRRQRASERAAKSLEKLGI
jgi:hypothetical protein